jgi:hypothetical protein
MPYTSVSQTKSRIDYIDDPDATTRPSDNDIQLWIDNESAAFNSIVQAAGQPLPLDPAGGAFAWGVNFVETNVAISILQAKDADAETLKTWLARQASIRLTLERTPQILVEINAPASVASNFCERRPRYKRGGRRENGLGWL